MSYVPNPSDPTEPVASRTVESAAREFREIKGLLARSLSFPAADTPTNRGLLPPAADRAGRVLQFNATTGVPEAGPFFPIPVNSVDSQFALYRAAGTGAVATNVQSKLREFVSVKDFGAVGDGVADDTLAFNAAIAAGKRVFVPAGTYSVADIAVVNNMDVEGERVLNSPSILLVRNNNSGAFTHSANAFLNNIRIANLTIRASAGVTGARAYKQNDKSQYSAYVVFDGLETWQDLQIAFDGFFIFTRWENCRDGFFGTAPGGQTHHVIDSNPATYGQLNQTNLNQITNCQFFRSTYANGCIDISYGDRWDIRGTNFEMLSTLSIRARGIFGIHITGCWFEHIDSSNIILLGTSPAPNPQGVRIFEIDNCFCKAMPSNDRFVVGDWAGSTVASNINFATVPTSMVFTNASEVRQLVGIEVLSGTPTAFTANTRQIVQGIVRDARLESTVINTPETLNQNVLPIGPTSLGQANFTVSGITSKTDVTSTLKGNAVRFTLVGAANVAYYSIPSKMLDFLKGRTITAVASGYGGDSGSVADGVSVCIWQSVTPGFTNHAATGYAFTAHQAALQCGRATLTVDAGATSLHIGIVVGGSNAGRNIWLETMTVVLGNAQPTFTGL